MISFKTFLSEERKIGKKTPSDFYVHKDYVDKTNIPKDVYDKALAVVKKNYPDFHHTIVKHNAKTNDVSFLHSPDWNTAHEPTVGDSVKVTSTGEHKFRKTTASPQIYHQKWTMVGDDHKGFDVEKSKDRTKKYQTAIKKVADKTGQTTTDINRKTGFKNYWDKEIVPHIEKD